MDKTAFKRALRQYIRYFRVWFIVTGILVAVTLGYILVEIDWRSPRKNTKSPNERVYDYADVLNDREERALGRLIEKYEKKCCIDIVIVTLNEPMGISDSDWEWNMMNYADDFYDDGEYGWNKAHGDGVLLLDNWYEDTDGSQKGSWLSTSGRMERRIGAKEEGEILDAMYVYIDRDPYKAYRAAVASFAAFEIDEDNGDFVQYVIDNKEIYFFVLLIPFVAALAYACVQLKPSIGSDTTISSTYVNDGIPRVRSRSDNFIRKDLVSCRIQSDDNNSNSTGSRDDKISDRNNNRSRRSSDQGSISGNARGGGSYGHHISGGSRTGSGGGSRRTVRSSGGKSGSSGGYSHGGGGRRR